MFTTLKKQGFKFWLSVLGLDILTILLITIILSIGFNPGKGLLETFVSIHPIQLAGIFIGLFFMDIGVLLPRFSPVPPQKNGSVTQDVTEK